MIPSVLGFLASNLLLPKLLMTALLSTKPWEHNPEVINLPWRDEEELMLGD